MEDTIIITIIIVAAFLLFMKNKKELTPEEKEEKARRREQSKKEWAESIKVSEFGMRNSAIIYPHCQTKGSVRTKPVKRKKGISGAKATGALLTGGISLLATGLSKKEMDTQAHCDTCNSTWFF